MSDAEVKNTYIPDYPSTIVEAIQMLQDMHDEDDTKEDFMTGYRMGLRVAINILSTLKVHHCRGNEHLIKLLETIKTEHPTYAMRNLKISNFITQLRSI